MIETYDELLDEKTLYRLSNYVKTVPWSYSDWHSNKHHGFAHWNYDIVRKGNANIASVLPLMPEAVKSTWEKIKTVVPEKAYPIRNYLNCHTYGVEGYPHADSPRADEVTAVIYLTPKWQREWAGATVFYEGDNAIAAVSPKYGRVSIFPATIPHAATAVSRTCPVPRITMALKLRCAWQDKELLRLEGFLRKHGTHEKRHGRGSLMAHLVRVYEILKANGAHPDVCLAGGLHSLYGTQAYKHVTLTDRAFIRQEFGEAVETLVHDFSKFKSSGELYLKAIQSANLRDQA